MSELGSSDSGGLLADSPAATVRRFMTVYQVGRLVLHQLRHALGAPQMALQDDTISIKERLQHLFLPDAKLTTLERTTVHTRSALLARLDKGVQQLKQMAGSAQRFEVQVGEVEPAGDDTQVVVLRVRQGMLRLTIRAEFVMAVDNGRCRIRHLAFKRGSQ